MKLSPNPNFSSETMDFVQDVLEVGDLAKEMRASGQVRAQIKTDGSRVTNADFAVEIEQAKRIERRSPGFRSVFEEDISLLSPSLAAHELSEAELPEILSLPEVYFSDPLDYTLAFLRGMSGWGTQWCRMRHGEFDLSVYYAPEDHGGFICAAERGAGTWYYEDTTKRWTRALTLPRLPGEMPTASHSTAIAGTSWFTSFFVGVRMFCEAVAIVGPGLGGAYAACGKVDLHILGPHHPWDWVPHVLLAEEAEKAYRLYRCFTEQGTELFDRVDAAALNPHKEPVGMLVGTPELVDKASKVMERVMNKRD